MSFDEMLTGFPFHQRHTETIHSLAACTGGHRRTILASFAEVLKLDGTCFRLPRKLKGDFRPLHVDMAVTT